MSMRDCLLDSIEEIRNTESITDDVRQEVVESLEKVANDKRLTDETKLARSITLAKEYRKDIFVSTVSKQADEMFQTRLRESVERYDLEERLSTTRRMLESFYSIRGDNTQSSPSVSNLMRAETQRAVGGLNEVWDAIYERTGMKITYKDSDLARSVHQEMLGIDTGNGKAVDLANQVRGVLNEYTQRMKEAGVYVEERDNYFPQSTDVAKKQTSREEWVRYMRDNLDPTRHPDPDATIERVESTLATRHLSSEDDAAISMQRQLEFKSPEAEAEYFYRFGEGDSIAETLFDAVDGLARKTVLAENLGPSAGRNAKTVIQQLREENAEAISRLESEVEAGNEGSKAQLKKLKKDEKHGLAAEWTLESMTGEIHNPANQNLAAWGNASRNWMIAQMLGKVPMSIVGQDFWISVFSSRFHSGGFGKALSQQVKGIVDVLGKENAREYAKKMGAWANALQAGSIDRYSSTFQTAEATRSTSRNAANAMQRASGVYALDNTLRGATMLNLSTNMMEATAHSWSDLNPRYTRVLQNNGWDSAKWDKFRKAAKAHEGTGAVDVESLPRDLRDLTLGFLYRELDSAVIHPQHFDRAVMSAGAQAGTVSGELAATVTQFWSWPIAMFRNAAMREMSMGGTGAAGFAGGMIAAGMLTTQIYEAIDGNPTFTMESPELWKRGIARSGLLTPVGELALEAATRRGADLSGPVADTALSTISNFGSATADFVDGESDKGLRKILQSTKDLTIPNLWWTQYSLTSRAMDHAMWELDPEYMADREREYIRQHRNN